MILYDAFRTQKAELRYSISQPGSFAIFSITTAFIAFTTFTLPTIQSWYQQQEPLNPSAPTAGSRNLIPEAITLEPTPVDRDYDQW